MFYFEKAMEYLRKQNEVTPHTSRYHTEDYLTHCQMVIDAVKPFNDEVLFMAAVLHDIAKPRCHAVNKFGGNCFYNHEMVTRDELSEFISEDDVNFDRVFKLVRYHMLPYTVCGPEPWASEAREKLNAILAEEDDEFAIQLERLHQADIAGSISG